MKMRNTLCALMIVLVLHNQLEESEGQGNLQLVIVNGFGNADMTVHCSMGAQDFGFLKVPANQNYVLSFAPNGAQVICYIQFALVEKSFVAFQSSDLEWCNAGGGKCQWRAHVYHPCKLNPQTGQYDVCVEWREGW
uniref:S-protein homolog n=1 Tax=Kalanchoe fedtschenkoi TaxID=63787 RepID=A0A7N0UE18_KALFE